MREKLKPCVKGVLIVPPPLLQHLCRTRVLELLNPDTMACPTPSFSALNALAAVEGEDKVVKMCEDYLAFVRGKRAGIAPSVWDVGAAACELLQPDATGGESGLLTPPRPSSAARTAAVAALRALAAAGREEGDASAEPPAAWCWAPRRPLRVLRESHLHSDTPLLRRLWAAPETTLPERSWACEALLCRAAPEPAAVLAELRPVGAGAAAAAGAPSGEDTGRPLRLHEALLRSGRKNGLENTEFMRIYNLTFKMGERCDWRDGLTRELADQTRSYVLECLKDHSAESPVSAALNTILSNLDTVFPVSEETQWSWPAVAPCVEAPLVTKEVRQHLRVTCEKMLNDPMLSAANHDMARSALAALDRLDEREQKEESCALHTGGLKSDDGRPLLGYSRRSDGAYSSSAPLCTCGPEALAAAVAEESLPAGAHSEAHYTNALSAAAAAEPAALGSAEDDDLYA